jgi:hypothetical protein
MAIKLLLRLNNEELNEVKKNYIKKTMNETERVSKWYKYWLDVLEMFISGISRRPLRL